MSRLILPGRPSAQKKPPPRLKSLYTDAFAVLDELEALYQQNRGTELGLAFFLAEEIVYDHRVRCGCAGCVYLGGSVKQFRARQMGVCLRCRRYERLPDFYTPDSQYRKNHEIRWYNIERKDTTDRERRKLRRLKKTMSKRRKERLELDRRRAAASAKEARAAEKKQQQQSAESPT